MFSILQESQYSLQADCGIRDYGKKVHAFEMELETTIDKLNKATEEYEEKDKMHAEVFLPIKPDVYFCLPG